VRFDGATLECVALTFAARHAGEAALVEVVRHGARHAVEVPQRRSAAARAP